jgi:hypothetical protein
VFVLSATSIWCLLSEFYGLCEMRLFTFAILIPATAVLIGLAAADRVRGDGLLWRGVVIGAVAGFLAACAYDIFRIPFVVGGIDMVGHVWLRLPLLMVFPGFGALFLGQPLDPTTTVSNFTLTAHLVGWVYHFSNGITFGVMYMALVDDASRRSWWWAVVFATGLELAMLFTPYTTFFGIHMTTRFVIVTFTAHAIFGVALGLAVKWMSDLWSRPSAKMAGLSLADPFWVELGCSVIKRAPTTTFRPAHGENTAPAAECQRRSAPFHACGQQTGEQCDRAR